MASKPSSMSYYCHGYVTGGKWVKPHHVRPFPGPPCRFAASGKRSTVPRNLAAITVQGLFVFLKPARTVAATARVSCRNLQAPASAHATTNSSARTLRTGYMLRSQRNEHEDSHVLEMPQTCGEIIPHRPDFRLFHAIKTRNPCSKAIRTCRRTSSGPQRVYPPTLTVLTTLRVSATLRVVHLHEVLRQVSNGDLSVRTRQQPRSQRGKQERRYKHPLEISDAWKEQKCRQTAKGSR